LLGEDTYEAIPHISKSNYVKPLISKTELQGGKNRSCRQYFSMVLSSAFVVYLRESTPENVGVAGELLEDRLKQK